MTVRSAPGKLDVVGPEVIDVGVELLGVRAEREDEDKRDGAYNQRHRVSA